MFGAFLREARQRAGLSQTDLAIRSGLLQTHLSRYELGEEPSVLTAQLLAGSLGLTIDQLRGVSRPPRGLTSPVLAGRLREARRIAKLTQRQAADGVGMDLTMLKRYEAGTHTPRVGRAIALADLYGVGLDELLQEEVSQQDLGML